MYHELKQNIEHLYRKSERFVCNTPGTGNTSTTTGKIQILFNALNDIRMPWFNVNKYERSFSFHHY